MMSSALSTSGTELVDAFRASVARSTSLIATATTARDEQCARNTKTVEVGVDVDKTTRKFHDV